MKTLRESINRGFNLMVTTVLFFGGLAFGFVTLSPVENDWGDRLDDIGLLVVGIACVVWYVIGRPRSTDRYSGRPGSRRLAAHSGLARVRHRVPAWSMETAGT